MCNFEFQQYLNLNLVLTVPENISFALFWFNGRITFLRLFIIVRHHLQITDSSFSIFKVLKNILDSDLELKNNDKPKTPFCTYLLKCLHYVKVFNLYSTTFSLFLELKKNVQDLNNNKKITNKTNIRNFQASKSLLLWLWSFIYFFYGSIYTTNSHFLNLKKIIP